MAGTIPETKYEVSAYLRLKGQFDQQMQKASRSITPATKRLQRLGAMAERVGGRMQMASASMMRFGRTAALAAGAAGTAGMGGMLVSGLRFNRTLEESKLALGTMFQMFDVGSSYLDKNATSAQIFAQNIKLAEGATARLMVLQKQTPAGFTDLMLLYKSGAAGLSKATPDVKRQLDLITQLSMLGPSVANDFGQIGRDTMRILTGGAGMEVLTWRLLKDAIHDAAKSTKMVSKNMETGDKWVEAFNRDLTSPQKLKLLEMAMAKLGPEFKKAFENSMDGLLSTTRSKINLLTGALTNPLYESFRRFLQRLNKENGIFGEASMKRWGGLISNVAGTMGTAAEKLFRAFERGARYVQEHWRQITDHIRTAFAFGALLIKGAIAKAMFGAVAGPALKLGGKAMGLAAKLPTGKIDTGAYGELVKRHGIGKGIVKAVAMDIRQNNIRLIQGKRLFKMPMLTLFLARLQTFATLIAPVVGILAVGLAAVAGGFLFVTAAVAGIAAYVIENWKSIMKSFSTGFGGIRPALVRVIEAAQKLWNGLVLLGKALLGAGGAGSLFVTIMDAMAATIGFVGDVIVLGLRVGQALYILLGAIEQILGGVIEGMGRITQFQTFGLLGKTVTDVGTDMQSTAAERMATVAGINTAIAAFEMGRGRATTAEQRTAMEGLLDRLRDWLGEQAAGDDKKGRKKAKGNVVVENMYNQWDLRNTDPDRIMSAFLPKLEKLNDMRTQSYEVADQGV